MTADRDRKSIGPALMRLTPPQKRKEDEEEEEEDDEEEEEEEKEEVMTAINEKVTQNSAARFFQFGFP